ncbi:MAG TPA: DNA-binding protein WhiA [Candidatus Baltobacteraceae bacterium]|nr:DNA-binding protein WhiA [Candidatus Baltobacteraceae bacterium]
MSLSADTKDALTREIPEAAHCREALLRGLALYGRTRDAQYFVTQRNAVARLFRSLLRGHHIEKIPGTRLRRVPSYRIALPPELREAPGKPLHRCDRVMEARAAFLACGSLSAGAQGYHLEFVLPDEEQATRLTWILRAVADAPKTMRRKARIVLYYKDFEAIVGLLTIVGAHGAVLHLEDVHALKETKNRIHRLVNTEAANLERAAAAAAGQRETIEFLSSAYGLQHLSPALREIAQLRLRYPDESLSELGRRCNPPIAKPTVNSRLMALARLAKRLQARP